MPTIEENGGGVLVTIQRKTIEEVIAERDNVGVNVPVKLTETQRKILELVRNNPSITHTIMAQQLSINEKTAKRATQALREYGVIRRDGSDKTGTWVVLEPNNVELSSEI